MTVTTDLILTVDTVPQYFKDHWKDLLGSSLSKIVDDDGVLLGTVFEKIKVQTIQGGNVNYAFCVQLPPELGGKTVFLKQAPEFVAIFGPDGFPLTSERMQLEMDVYGEWKTLLGESASAEYLPTIYFFDKKQMVVIMEFLEGYELLDHVLVSSSNSSYNVDNESTIARSLGTFMGTVHAMTHSSSVSSDRKEYLRDHYTNRALRDVQLEFVFTKAYKEATNEQRSGLNLSDDFLKEIDIIKTQYDGRDPNCGYVLCHGDLHPGSVMVDVANNGGGSTKVIDPEFTIYGPAGLDVGSLIHGYCLGAIHQAYSNNQDAASKNVRLAKVVWSSYKSALVLSSSEGGNILSANVLKQIEVETVGFTLAEVCRTALEFAGGRKWLQFDDKQTKLRAKKAALSLVDACMIERHTGGIDLMFDQLAKVSTL